MKKYESVVILNPEVTEEQKIELINKIIKVISMDGQDVSANEWGKRRFTYPINKKNEGYYILFTFEAEPSSIKEIERIYGITDEILKFMIISRD